MAKPTSTSRPLLIMMSIMVLWQCLFVAVEAGAAVSPSVDIHHLVTVSADPHHPCPDAPCPSHPTVDSTHEHSDNSDSCDHCCACQGHSSHLSIHLKVFVPPLEAPGFQPVAVQQERLSLYPPSIYRPPIG